MQSWRKKKRAQHDVYTQIHLNQPWDKDRGVPLNWKNKDDVTQVDLGLLDPKNTNKSVLKCLCLFKPRVRNPFGCFNSTTKSICFAQFLSKCLILGKFVLSFKSTLCFTVVTLNEVAKSNLYDCLKCRKLRPKRQ